jgi:glycosyltransferase involved in cell wall biosynthesis
MKILFIQETERIHGKAKQQQHLAEMLANQGHQVHVIDNEISKHSEGKRGIFLRQRVTSNGDETQKEASVSVIYPGLIKIPLLNSISSFITHRREIKRQIEEFKPEVIVGWGVISSYLAANAAEKNNIPFVYYWVDVLDLLIPGRLPRSVGKILVKRALEKSKLVLTLNEKLKDYVISIGALQNRTQVMRAGIDLDQFNPVFSGIETRKLLGIDGRDFVLCFVGWLYHLSRLGNILQALSKNGNPQLKLLIVGEGEAYADLQVLRDRYRLGKRVVLTGNKEHSEMPRLIAASDICILPTDPSEPLFQHTVPLEIYEYMAMKKPVIATKLPGVMKEFGEGNGVIYVDQPKDIITKAEELKNSGYATMMRHGLIASKFVLKHSWRRIARDFEALLKKVVEEKAGA